MSIRKSLSFKHSFLLQSTAVLVYNSRFLILCCIGLFCVPLLAQAQHYHVTAAGLPDSIAIHESNLFPEGIAWDSAGHRFFVSSVSRGSVTEVRDDGSHKTFAPGKNMKSTFGMEVDESRNRLLVAANDALALKDSTRQGEAKLAIYNLKTGRRKHLVNLGSLRPKCRHLGNDVAIGPNGVAYVTDSLCPVIYKVTPAGKASVFVEDARFGGHGFNLNGIAYHRGGYLLVALDAGRALYRVPVDKPESMYKVKISHLILPDGMVVNSMGDLIDAEPNLPAILQLRSTDDWKTAHVVKHEKTTRKEFTTAVSLRNGKVYYLKTYLTQRDGKQPVKTFKIVRADW